MKITYRDVLEILIRRLPPPQPNDEVFERDAELYFRACIEVLLEGEDRGDGPAVKLLNEVQSGYGCWLEDVQGAIDAARADFPLEYTPFYERLKGASAMAGTYLLNRSWTERASSPKG